MEEKDGRMFQNLYKSGDVFPMADEIEEIRKRYKDKHQQYNSPIIMWDDMRVVLEKIKTTQEHANRLEAERRRDALDGQCALDEANNRIKELETDQKLNASMLAKQCDLARETETEREHLSKLLIKERIRIVELEEETGRREKVFTEVVNKKDTG